MKSSITIIVAAALTLGVGQAMAQTPPEGLVWMVLNDINAASFDPEDPTNRPPLVTTPPPGVLRSFDINGDGLADWLVDYGRAGESLFCGTGGCTRRLYVSGGDTGYRRIFDAQVLELDVVDRDGETRIEARAHALNCYPDRVDCRFAWAWDEGEGRLVERVASDGVTLLEDGGFDPVDVATQNLPDILPVELSQAWFGGRRTCQDWSDDGYETRRPLFRSVPDLNGDGRRDWIEIPALCPLDDSDRARFSIWTTTPDAGLETAYESGGEAYPVLDLGRSPAAVLVRPACDADEGCAPVVLQWDEVQRRLVPKT